MEKDQPDKYASSAASRPQESEAKYRGLFDRMDQGVCVLDVIFDGNGKPVDLFFVEVNGAFEAQSGIRNAAGKLASEAVPGLEAHWFEIYGKVAMTGEPERFTEGAEELGRWFEVFAFKVGDADSKKVAVLFSDITRGIEAVKELKESKGLLQTVFDSAPNGIALLQAIYQPGGELVDFKILLFNQFTLRWIGNIEYKGKRYSEVFPNVVETGILERFKEILRTGNTQTFERWYEGEGMHHWFRFTAATQGDLLIVTTEDISERKRAEENLKTSQTRFKNMIEQAPIGTCLFVGREMRVEVANQIMIDYWGKGDAVIGKPLAEALPELVGQPFLQQLDNVFTTGRAYEELAAKAELVVGGSLKTYYFNYTYKPVYNERNEVYGIMDMAVDVTAEVIARRQLEESERKYRELSQSLEEQVKQRTAELQRSNVDLLQFAHVASHDLKESVRKVKTFASRLRHELGDEISDRSKEFLRKMDSAADRMYTMIDGVLNYSSTNGSTEQLQKVDINAVLADIEEDLELTIQHTGTTITYRDLPTVEGAPVLLYQLFYNLINNSIKFAKAETPTTITISSEASSPAVSRITVADTGIGFEQSHAEKIFDTFIRLNSKDKYEGTGLGLALCKKIVERHGGTIEAHGSPGQGASFVIELPLTQASVFI